MSQRKHSESIPSLTALCQNSILSVVEDSGYNARLINDIAKRLTLLENLLEPLLAALVRKNAVTDVAFLAFLHPGRHTLEIAGLSGIRNSTLKLIGYNCSNLVSFDASNCAQMSNSIVRCVLQGCALLEDICLNGCPRISDAAFDPGHCPFDRLKAADTLKTISLKGCRQITGSCAVVFQKVFRRLTSIDLSQCKHIVSSTVCDLVTHRTLTSLDLSFVGCIGDESFPKLPALDLPMRQLSLCQSRITDASLVTLTTAIRNVTSLRLQWCGGITDTGIAVIVDKCPYLKQLDVQSCNITDLSLESISTSCDMLEELDVSWCVGITDAGVRALAGSNLLNKLLHFKVLKMTWCSQLSDESIVELSSLQELRVLDCFGFSMSNECRQKLEQSGVMVRTEIDPVVTSS